MNNPIFLFILTPPFSGSTALAKILNSSPQSMTLTEKAEGQWLIPSLCGDDRWNPDKIVDWDLVASTWYARYHQICQITGPKDVIIEKSPPNMMRIEQYLEAFPNSRCFAFIRDPYASCSSYLYRRFPTDSLNADARASIVGQLIEEWLIRSRRIQRAIESMQLQYFTYEEFCADTEKCIKLVLTICPELGTVDCGTKVKVKNYPVQGISNHNSRQIELLTEADVDTISHALANQRNLPTYFGYKIR